MAGESLSLMASASPLYSGQPLVTIAGEIITEARRLTRKLLDVFGLDAEGGSSKR